MNGLLKLLQMIDAIAATNAVLCLLQARSKHLLALAVPKLLAKAVSHARHVATSSRSLVCLVHVDMKAASTLQLPSPTVVPVGLSSKIKSQSFLA